MINTMAKITKRDTGKAAAWLSTLASANDVRAGGSGTLWGSAVECAALRSDVGTIIRAVWQAAGLAHIAGGARALEDVPALAGVLACFLTC